MTPTPFDRNEHIYRSDAFAELVKDAIRFFNGTPVHTLPPSTSFVGTGVYALYYTGELEIYKKYHQLNRLSYSAPIYVGKAVPKGWRQFRIAGHETSQGRELFSRLREHYRNVAIGNGLRAEDFMCRFVIFENESSDMIGTIEAALIKVHRPLWNSVLDGFGNHTPGNGRFQQAKSDWDVIHPGRYWAEKCMGRPTDKNQILAKIAIHMQSLEWGI